MFLVTIHQGGSPAPSPLGLPTGHLRSAALRAPAPHPAHRDRWGRHKARGEGQLRIDLPVWSILGRLGKVVWLGSRMGSQNRAKSSSYSVVNQPFLGSSILRNPHRCTAIWDYMCHRFIDRYFTSYVLHWTQSNNCLARARAQLKGHKSKSTVK